MENHINKRKFFAERSYRERNEREREREREMERGRERDGGKCSLRKRGRCFWKCLILTAEREGSSSIGRAHV